MTEPQSVKIAWGSPFKAPTVLMGEQLITQASRVTLDCETGQAPKIFLEFDDQSVEPLTLEGVVHVVREVPADPIAPVVEFLSNISGDELDRCVLEAMGMGGSQKFGDVALEIMKGWARGD